jgi:hypothetical protein
MRMSTTLGTDINHTKECAIWISVDIDVLDISSKELEHLGR